MSVIPSSNSIVPTSNYTAVNSLDSNDIIDLKKILKKDKELKTKIIEFVKFTIAIGIAILIGVFTLKGEVDSTSNESKQTAALLNNIQSQFTNQQSTIANQNTQLLNFQTTLNLLNQQILSMNAVQIQLAIDTFNAQLFNNTKQIELNQQQSSSISSAISQMKVDPTLTHIQNITTRVENLENSINLLKPDNRLFVRTSTAAIDPVPFVSYNSPYLTGLSWTGQLKSHTNYFISVIFPATGCVSSTQCIKYELIENDQNGSVLQIFGTTDLCFHSPSAYSENNGIIQWLGTFPTTTSRTIVVRARLLNSDRLFWSTITYYYAIVRKAHTHRE
jgi:hypothetical protein